MGSSESHEKILEIQTLSAHYGQVEALHSIDLDMFDGELVAVLGPNGAGKSTLLRSVMGLTNSTGTVRFRGKVLPRRGTSVIAKRGVVLVPEGRGIFGPMTVEENLDLGAYTRKKDPSIAQDREELLGLFPILKKRYKGLAGNLSGGEQQMLAMGRALMAKPRLLLLDEPSLGLAPMMIDVVFSLIEKINQKGITVLLVEQNAFKALELAHYAYVIESGRIQLSGTGRELLASPAIKQAYLGE